VRRSLAPLVAVAVTLPVVAGMASASASPTGLVRDAVDSPRVLATGTLSSGVRWKLVATFGAGHAVCLHTRGSGKPARACAPYDPWTVGSLDLTRTGGRGSVVFTALPSCVTRLELLRRGRVVGRSATTTDDDVAYGVVAGPSPLTGVVLRGIGRTGVLLRVDRLLASPHARLPPVAR
jgi:hypothetical protein